MALTLPSAPYPGHDTRFYRVAAPIIAADVSAPGAHWQHLAGGVNLALATLHAGAIASDSWADGHGAVMSPGLEGRLWYPIPPAPSSRHTTIRVVIEYASGAGTLRASTIAGADLYQEVVVGDGTFEATLDVDTAGGFDDLVLATADSVEFVSVEVSWSPLVAAGWPAADGVLPDAAFDSIDPLDDADFDVDELLSSGRMLVLHEAAEHLAARRRSYFSTSAIGGAGADPGRFVCRPIRRVVPVPYRGVLVAGRLRVANPTEDALRVWVQRSAGGPRVVAGQVPDVALHPVEIGAESALDWVTFEAFLRDSREFGAPQDLPGWTQLAIYPEPGLALHSVGIWEA